MFFIEAIGSALQVYFYSVAKYNTLFSSSVLLFTLIAGFITCGQWNPAVTLTIFISRKKVDWNLMFLTIISQFFGAILVVTFVKMELNSFPQLEAEQFHINDQSFKTFVIFVTILSSDIVLSENNLK